MTKEPPERQVEIKKKPSRKPFWDRRITFIEILIAVVIIVAVIWWLLPTNMAARE